MRSFLLKYLSFIFCYVCCCSFVSAQKYKDLYPIIAAATDEDALPILKQYLIEDLDHPNANLKIALIYDRRYKAADVLTEYDKAIANAERAKLMLTKTSQLIDDKDMKKNPGYYSDFSQGIDSKGKPIVEYSTISKVIIDKHDSITVFLEKLPPIYSTFINAVNSYDKAIKIFAGINNTYNSLDELFMLFDSNLSNQLSELKQAYDSTILYLDHYKLLISNYPIQGYHQNYSIKNIETYRLSGLITQSDFLGNNIQLWNYGMWVDDVNAVMKTDISALRTKIITYENALNASLKNASNPSLYSTFEPLKTNKELLFTLKKYDGRSLLVGVFQYKDFLQNVQHKSNSNLYYDTAKDVAIDTKYAFYSDMINGYYLADSMINVTKLRLTADNVARHQSFIDDYYKGYSGMQQYVDMESNTIQKEFNKYVLSLRNSIVEDLNNSTHLPATEVRYKKLKIPLIIDDTTSIESLAVGAMSTSHYMESADGSQYIAGTYKKPGKLNNTIAYVLRLNSGNAVSWYKEYEISIDSTVTDSNSWVSGMVLNPEGCAVIIRSAHLQNESYANTIIYLNEVGEEKLVKRLETIDYPRALNYAQTTNSFIIAFKGDSPRQDVKAEQDFTMLNINVLGDHLWRYTSTFSGTIEDVAIINNGFIVVGNFTARKDNAGTVVRTRIGENQTNAFADIISSNGKLVNTELIISPKSYYIKKVVKVNDRNINLLGKVGIYDSGAYTKFDFSNSLAHIITNSKLIIIHNSIE